MKKKLLPILSLGLILALSSCHRNYATNQTEKNNPAISDTASESVSTDITPSTKESKNVEPSTSTIVEPSTTDESKTSAPSTIVEPSTTDESKITAPSTEPLTSDEKTTQPSESTEEKIKYTVSFMVDGEVVSEAISIDGESVNLPNTPTKSGYRFDNWYIGDTDEVFDKYTAISNNLTIKARFIEQVTITFSSTYTTHESITQDIDLLLTNIVTPTYAGYEFLGWYVDKACSTKFDSSKPITSNLTLYASWKQIEVSTDTLNVTAYSGYTEGAYIEFENVAGYSQADYKVYYKSSSESTFTQIDSELIRLNNSTIRADILGLPEGSYTIKAELAALSLTCTKNVTVTADDRSGYAHFNYTSGVGAYNDDGSIKANTQIIYVSEETKNTVKATIDGKEYTGIVNILQNQSKSSNPMIVRILGTIGCATWNKISYSGDPMANGYLSVSSSIDGTDKIVSAGYNIRNTSVYSEITGIRNKLVVSSSEYDSYWNMCDVSAAKNLTVEGIGTDAKLDNWGFTWSKCNSIEIKNLTFSNNPEDACSFQGGSNSDVKTYGNYWIHNCTFNRGNNDWDICSEQDKHYGDGCVDLKYCHNVTLAYCQFNNCKKTGLIGGSDSALTMNVTFHHNYYNGVGSRLPLGRQVNLHAYNNYYYNCSTCQDMRANSFTLSEYNYFSGCTYCQKVTTTATYTGTIIKSYNDYMTSGSSAATKVTDRTEKLSGACKPDGSTDYTNFDTDSSLFYYNSDNLCSDVEVFYETNELPNIIPQIAGAGKLQSIDKSNFNSTEVTKYTVTFNSNGGSSVDSKTIKENGVISTLPTPELSGYNFGGWYLDNETFNNKFTETTNVTANITLYAKWVLITTSEWTTILNETFDTAVTPTEVSQLPTSAGLYYQISNIKDSTDTAYDSSENYVSVSSNTLNIIDESAVYTTFGYYMFSNTYTSGKVKYTVKFKTSSENSKWSMVHFLDENTNVAIRTDSSKYLSYVTDGNNDNTTNILSTALKKNTEYTVVLEIDYDNSIATITIDDTTVSLSSYTPSKISGIMFQTATGARNVYCTSIKIEIA